jgi:hypothetical protein
MKWLWIILGTLAALVALVAIIGAMLPVKHVATKRARFNQPPEALWAAIDGPQDWRPGFGKYEVLPERNGHKVWREDLGQGEPVMFERIAADPPRRLETKIISTGIPFGGAWVYELNPTPAGTDLRITENGEVYNIIFRFVSRFVMGHTSTIETTLRALGKKFGEQVTIEN